MEVAHRVALETKRGQVVTLTTSVAIIAMGSPPPAQLAGQMCVLVSRRGGLHPPRLKGPGLTRCSFIPRRLMNSRSSSTRNVPTTTWNCTTGLTARPPSSAVSAAARSRTPWWPQAAACFSGFIRMPRCRGEDSRPCTAQVRGLGPWPSANPHVDPR